MAEGRPPRKQRPDGWTAVADLYPEVLEPLTAAYAQRLFALLDPPDGPFLDIACGPGVLAELAAVAGYEVTAVDFSPGMVDRARRRLAAHRGAEVREMNAAALDLPTDGYGAAASNFGLIFVPNVTQGLREAVRVVRPGGRVGLTAWTSPAALEWATILDDAVDAVAGSDLDREPSVMQWGSPAELAGTLITAGLTDVEISIEAHDWAVASPDAFGEYLRVSPNSAELFDHLDGAVVDRIVATAVEAVRDRHGNGPVALASEAYVAVGTVA